MGCSCGGSTTTEILRFPGAELHDAGRASSSGFRWDGRLKVGDGTTGPVHLRLEVG